MTALTAVTLVVLTALAAAPAPVSAAGRITYGLNEGHLFRIAARAGATPEDITLKLDALSAGGDDRGLNTSPDGRFLVLQTDRFGCAGFPCLALVTGNLSSGAAVRAGGQLVHVEGFAAVASGGTRVVYPSQDGPHQIDLWTARRSGSAFAKPKLLTRRSSFPYNSQPALSDSGGKVVFDCGKRFPGEQGTGICKVSTGHPKVTRAIGPKQGPGGTSRNALHHPDFGPRGSIVFEADWQGEQIWRLRKGRRKPSRVSRVGNDNSPCVLPDGRITSLFLNRPGNPTGFHEIRVTDERGLNPIMPLIGVDVSDAGIGCSA